MIRKNSFSFYFLVIVLNSISFNNLTCLASSLNEEEIKQLSSLLKKYSTSSDEDKHLREKLSDLYSQYMSKDTVKQDKEDLSKISIFCNNANSPQESTFFIPKSFENKIDNSPVNISCAENEIEFFHGQIKAYSDEYSPTYGSGILLSPQHVLTIASCVFYGKNPAKTIEFLAYPPLENERSKPIEIKHISVHHKYLKQYSKDMNYSDYALLTLKTEVSLIQSIYNQTAYNAKKNILNEKYYNGVLKGLDLEKHKINLIGYKETSRKIEKFHIKKFESEQDFLLYDADTVPGAGGAGLWLKESPDYCFPVGLHLGKNSKEHFPKKALKLSLEILRTLEFMKNRSQALSLWEDKNASTLDLSHMDLQNLDFSATLKKYYNLRKINLQNSHINAQKISDLVKFLKNQFYRTLEIDLKNNDIASKEIEVLKALIIEYKLLRLHLDSKHSDSKNEERLFFDPITFRAQSGTGQSYGNIQGNSNVHAPTIENEYFTTNINNSFSAGQILTFLEKNILRYNSLNTLSLEGYQMVENDVNKTIKILEKCATIRHLNLAQTGFGDEESIIMAGYLINPLHPVLTLDLSRNRLTDKGAECFLDALETNESLEKIDLNENKISSPLLEKMTNILSKRVKDYKITKDEGKEEKIIPVIEVKHGDPKHVSLDDKSNPRRYLIEH